MDDTTHNDRIDRRLDGPPPADVANLAAWELVDVGRFRPRRIRGSFRGRELG